MGAFAAALGCSLLLSGFAIPVLRRAQFMDVPNHRSSHSKPVPRGGGAAVVVALLAVAAVLVDLNGQVLTLLAATLFLAVVGLIDDVRSLSSGSRLVAQLLAATVLAGALLAVGSVSWWWFPVLVVAVAGYVNAYNFMDGVNGISGLTAAVVGFHWAWAGHNHGDDTLMGLGLILAGAAVGFLPWNAPRAKVFLGDVGSYGVGVFVVGLSVLALTSGLPWQWALAPLVVYGADTGWVLLKRKRGGRSLTEAHREHVYQRLVDSGWSHLASAACCAVAGALVCAVTLAAGESVRWWAVMLAVLLVLAYLSVPALQRKKVPA